MSNMTTPQYDCDEILSRFPPPPALSPAEKNISCMLIVLFAVVTLVGNTLVVFVVAKYKQLQMRTNAYIVSVAFADAGIAVFIMPFRIYEIWNNTWDLGRWFCSVLTLMDLTLCSVSMANLYCLGFERYLAVCKPFVHQRIKVQITALSIAACWILPFAGWMITLFDDLYVIGIEGLVECASDGACPFFINIPITIISTVCTFYLPTLCLLYFYLCIFLTARKHTRAIVDLNASEHQRKEIQKIKKTLKAALILGIVIGCYIVCWAPANVVFSLEPFVNYQTPLTIKLAVTWLAYINSMFNPILYYVFNQQFRHAYKAVLYCKKMTYDDEMTA